jgi:hypothetical protein
MKVLFFSYVSILFEEETRFLFLGEIFAEIFININIRCSQCSSSSSIRGKREKRRNV